MANPSLQLPAEARILEFQERIFGFYASSARRFPWRMTRDRYAVMVSEVMLQQTQAERVVPKYLDWLGRFPDPGALAEAPLRDVLMLWSGLGYNSRARRLQECARLVMEEYGGEVPGDPALLRRLPGIGRYTSHSIPAFADNLDVAAVDTNIRRILIHEFSLPEDASDRALQEVADRVLPQGRSRDWHNALMDYGALHLTSRQSGIRSRSRQSKFEGSRRWYRGCVLRELLEQGTVPQDDLMLRHAACPGGIGSVVDELVRERMVEYVPGGSENGTLLRIRE
ncbi:Fe-S cluster assembly protein HesB [Chlorobium sp. N1]|uniref:Fe-S cluster assembly protein HesB n=1 Tax=Chlorobium sp. N1 TaxID=2491138 RepID=UPI00103E17EC|nr:Fe-S cluster assembly protein HesB [Chlorobium sp. N1]TCD48356.1 Fe-S cluster assembly protein HesB [Chlorobium sp. N1]